MQYHRTPPLAAILIILLLSLVLSFFAAGDGVLPGDLWIATAFHAIDGSWAEAIDYLGYWLGSLPAIIGVAAVLMLALLAIGRFPEAFLLLGVVVVRSLNPVLKSIFESPRPTPDLVRVTENATNYGFPSGHVMGVVLLYGGIFYLAHENLPRRPARLTIQGLCILVVVIASFSRVYSGAHWPSDVLGGYLWGTFILLMVLDSYNRVRVRRASEAQQPQRNSVFNRVRGRQEESD